MKGMETDDLLCSRNARLKKALVGRAQWKINQPPSLKRERASSEGSIIMGSGRLGKGRASTRPGLGGWKGRAQLGTKPGHPWKRI